MFALCTNVCVKDFVKREIDIARSAYFTFRIFPLIEREEVVVEQTLPFHCVQALLLQICLLLSPSLLARIVDFAIEEEASFAVFQGRQVVF